MGLVYAHCISYLSQVFYIASEKLAFLFTELEPVSLFSLEYLYGFWMLPPSFAFDDYVVQIWDDRILS